MFWPLSKPLILQVKSWCPSISSTVWRWVQTSSATYSCSPETCLTCWVTPALCAFYFWKPTSAVPCIHILLLYCKIGLRYTYFEKILLSPTGDPWVPLSLLLLSDSRCSMSMQNLPPPARPHHILGHSRAKPTISERLHIPSCVRAGLTIANATTDSSQARPTDLQRIAGHA